MTASLLNLTKPGAAVGQIILAVDLTIAGDTTAVMQAIAELGYTPEIRHVLYPEGVHVFAVLVDEVHTETPDDEHMMEEWLQLQEVVDSEAVHLWRGRSSFEPHHNISLDVA